MVVGSIPTAPTMRKFLLFMGMYYYPAAGYGDLVGSFDTQQDAINVLLKDERNLGRNPNYEWAQIIEVAESGTTLVSCYTWDENEWAMNNGDKEFYVNRHEGLNQEMLGSNGASTNMDEESTVFSPRPKS